MATFESIKSIRTNGLLGVEIVKCSAKTTTPSRIIQDEIREEDRRVLATEVCELREEGQEAGPGGIEGHSVGAVDFRWS